MDSKQKERITKYSYRINVATTSKKDLKEYIETKIYKYIYKNFIDYTLWLLFQEEFKGFTIKDFKKIYPITKVKLCAHLF